MLSIARPLVVVALLPFLVAAGGLRSLHHDAMKVRGFEAPIGWEQQPAGSYPRLLAQWETKDGGRMTLVAQKVRAGLDAHGLAAQSQPALERQGFRAIAIADER